MADGGLNWRSSRSGVGSARKEKSEVYASLAMQKHRERQRETTVFVNGIHLYVGSGRVVLHVFSCG